jgi:hypothetical protein
MIDPATNAKLKAIYQSLQDQELEPGDRRYVALFENPSLSTLDPVADMIRAIEYAALESVQLFSGHRGTGKTTQLHRLKGQLERDPTYKVVVCDMDSYLPMTEKVDVVDFLLAAAGALSDALSDPDLLGADPTRNYWDRFVGWLRGQRIAVEELGLDVKTPVAPGIQVGATVKLNLKYDAEFRKRVRERTKLHVGAFRAEVHDFAQDCLKQLRKRFGDDTQLVVIYDSIEHLRGITGNADEVADSVEQLFRGHAEALRFPFIHMVFTVPPWLRLQYAGTGKGFDNYCQIPCIKVTARPEHPGAPVVPNLVGLDALWALANKRGDMTWLLGDRAAFDELALASGGYLRDLLHVLMGIVRDVANYGLPLSAERRRLAIEELRNGYLGFTNREAAWLQRIEETGTLDIADSVDKHTIARFLDTHVLLGYRNGEDWYAVHPVIRADVARRAAAWHAAQASKAEP